MIFDERLDAKPTEAERAAAQELDEDVFELLQKAQRAKYLLNCLLTGFFEPENLDSSPETINRILCNYGDARLQIEILCDYLHDVLIRLVQLDALGSSGEQGGGDGAD